MKFTRPTIHFLQWFSRFSTYSSVYICLLLDITLIGSITNMRFVLSNIKIVRLYSAYFGNNHGCPVRPTLNRWLLVRISRKVHLRLCLVLCLISRGKFLFHYKGWKVQMSLFWSFGAEATRVQRAVWTRQIHSDKHQCRVGMSWPPAIFSFKRWSSHQDSAINIVRDAEYSMCVSVFPLLFLLSLGPAEECWGTDIKRDRNRGADQTWEPPLLAVPLSSFI